ncbi:MAG: hypothetical protein AAF449_10265 [Myxococcota bacterium]
MLSKVFRPLWAVVAGLLGGSLIACGDEALPPPPPGLFSVTLGSASDPVRGTGGFAAIDDLAELPLRPGSQGGLHVYINLRMSEAAVEAIGERPLIYREARRISDGRLVSRLEHRTQLVSSSTTGAFDTERSISLFLCPTPVGIDVANEPLELTVDVKTDYGEEPSAQGKVRFVPYCLEEGREFCLDLCIW